MEWLNNLLPNLSLPLHVSDEELREVLVDGKVLCQLLNKLKPDCVTEVVARFFFICKIAKVSSYVLMVIIRLYPLQYGGPFQSPESRSENVKRFLAAMDIMRLPRFKLSDLEKVNKSQFGVDRWKIS